MGATHLKFYEFKLVINRTLASINIFTAKCIEEVGA